MRRRGARASGSGWSSRSRRARSSTARPTRLTHALTIVLNEDQGRLMEAEPLYRRVLAGREAQLGVRHQDTIPVVIALADVLDRLGKLAESEQLYRSALERREEQPAASDAATRIYREDTLILAINLAGVLVAQGGQGRLDEAETLYRRELTTEYRP